MRRAIGDNKVKKSLRFLTAVILTAITACAFFGCETSSDSGQGGSGGGNVKDELTIDDISLICTSDGTSTFAKIKPNFSIPEKAEQLTYTYDTSKINIDENGVVTVKTKRTADVTVNAASKNYKTSFKVSVTYRHIDDMTGDSRYNYKTRFLSSYNSMKSRCESVINQGATTVVIGDSFTDDYFIAEWIATYREKDGKTKDLINAGINSTTSRHWQAMCGTLLGKVEPKNIVINIGTNDFYDGGQTVESVTESLQTLVMMLHSKFPSTKIWLFTINQRKNINYYDEVIEANAVMKAWTEEWDFVTQVDSCSLLTLQLLTDGIHPTSEGYDVMFGALEQAGIEYSYLN